MTVPADCTKAILTAACSCLLFFLTWGGFNPAVVEAVFTRVEEAPTTVLYRSRESLRDRSGNSWQVVAFRYQKSEESAPLTLRLVGFPGIVELAHPAPLEIMAETGETWQVNDWTDRSPAAHTGQNVGQYDLTTVMPQLPITGSLKLKLAASTGYSFTLRIPPFIVKEWRRVAEDP